jgi:hypothetical protein
MRIGQLQKYGRATAGNRLGLPHAGGKTPTLADKQQDPAFVRRATFADQAYEDADKRQQEVDGYQYDRSLSDANTAIYHNKEKGKTYMGLRGTKPTSANDLYHDYHIARGSQRDKPLYQKDQVDYEKVKAKYGGTIAASGHSLGGSRAQALSKKKGVQSTSFNPGTSVFDKTLWADKARCSLPKKLRPSWCSLRTSYHVKGDALSVSDRLLNTGKTTTFPTKGYNPLKKHLMSNFM